MKIEKKKSTDESISGKIDRLIDQKKEEMDALKKILKTIETNNNKHQES